MLASAVYATLVLDRYVGPVLLLGLLPPLRTETAPRSWDLLRALFGLVWLALLAHLRLAGHLSPLLSTFGR